MIKTDTRQLLVIAFTYIQDGKIVKWRWYEDEPSTMAHKIALKWHNKSPLSEQDVDYMVARGNMVVETAGEVKLFNFDTETLREMERENSKDSPWEEVLKGVCSTE